MALVMGSNSYGNRTLADAYFNDSLRKPNWAAIASASKDLGLIEATRVFERQAWGGVRVDGNALKFGRTGLVDTDGTVLTEQDSLEIMQEASFEYALYLIENSKALSQRDATGSNIKQAGAGSAKVIFFKAKKGSRFPLMVTELIGRFLSSNGSAVGGFVSGNEDSSSFTHRDCNYGLNDGFK